VLTQRTLDAVVRASAANQAEQSGDLQSGDLQSGDLQSGDAHLSELDEEALDALMLEGLQPARVPASLRERAHAAHTLLALAALPTVATTVTPTVAPTPSTRVTDATLARVLSARETVPITMPVSRRSGMPLREIASVAAVLLLGGITLWPMAAAASNARQRSVCESNMASLAGAFGRYGADFRGLLPVASKPSQRHSDAPWWNVGAGPAQSNSANLFTIHLARYAPIESSCCPGNPHGCRDMTSECSDWHSLEQVSYSYYVQFGEAAPTWEGRAGDSNTTVILADSSPVVRRAVRNEVVSVGENSANHAGSGQRVLRVDGSSDWLATPYDAGPGRNTRRVNDQGERQRLGTADNIWLPVSLEETLLRVRTQQEAGLTQGTIAIPTPEQAAKLRSIRLQGTETPGSSRDAFLGP
jgi:hypothetical protein